MKLVMTMWLVAGLILAVAPARGESPGRGLEQIQVNGKEYARLTRWAAANEFDVSWLKRDETLILKRASTQVQVTVDSWEARVNGVKVWLLHPVVNRNGLIYIAMQDLLTTLHPILSPPRTSRPPPGIQTICLDPGHGGKDPGYCVSGHEEKKYTLLLALELKLQLAKAGFKTSLTRTTDEAVERAARPDLARRRNADLFVSLHFNSTEGAAGTVSGAEVYCLTPPGASSTNERGEEGARTERFPGNDHNDGNLLLAYEVQKSLTRTLAEDRGVHRARFEVLCKATMPAVLIEVGYMSHPTEGKKIFDPAYRRLVAHSIVEGLLAYKHTVERQG
jgi:N-acetylmuramoyl-L-alanine amidase